MNTNPKSSRTRIKRADIFRPDGAKSGDENPSERGVVMYTFFGKHTYLDENGYPVLGGDDENDPQVLAKTVTFESDPRYYVKAGPNGKFFDPTGLDEGKEHEFDNRRGSSKWRFIEVNKRVFTFYINFLKTKNKAYLMNAEREVF